MFCSSQYCIDDIEAADARILTRLAIDEFLDSMHHLFVVFRERDGTISKGIDLTHKERERERERDQKQSVKDEMSREYMYNCQDSTELSYVCLSS